MRPFDDQHNTHPPLHPQAHKTTDDHLMLSHHEEATVKNKGPYFTLRQVATLLGCSYETVRQLVHKGKIRSYQDMPGYAIRISQEFLSEYLERISCHAQENLHALSELPGKTIGTSEMDGKSTARELRMRERLNAS